MKIFFKLLFLVTAVLQAEQVETILKIHGSNTIGSRLAPALIQGYLQSIGASDIQEIKVNAEDKEIFSLLKNGQKVKVEIEAHGSSTGFKDLNNSLCDIAISSRRIKNKEVQMLKRFGNLKDIEREHTIAIDGIAIFVNKNNPIDALSTQIIQDIYTGKIKDWSEISNYKGRINCYSRDKNSGTRDTFNALILKKKPLTQDVKLYANNRKLSEDVSLDSHGIGFGGIPYILNTKALAIKEAKTTIAPDTFTIATEDYPLSRRLYMYNMDTLSKIINDFIEFTLSSEGQKIVKDVGFIDLNIKEFKPKNSKEMPLKYRKIVKNLTRVSTSFRFKDDSEALDNRALRDIHRVATYLKENNIYKEDVYLLGFTNNKSFKSINKIHSLKKAKSIFNGLTFNSIFLDRKNIIGCGESYPLGNNETKNRRVEVWIKKEKVSRNIH